ncbi:MAG: 1-phosphofructokinase [Eubacteriales bacterium]|nr:1-phosphofructokinase [Eubacteriales bacterium]
MIYTLTLNPSLDYVVDVVDFQADKINRSTNEMIFPGGKGINVSQVLKQLDTESCAIGLVAGFTGEHLKHLLDAYGITHDLMPLSNGMTRINVKIRSRAETAVNGAGPQPTPDEVDNLKDRLRQLKSGDYLVMAGNLPKGLPDTLYRDIMTSLADRDVRTVVDATGTALTSVMDCGPFLIKPNHEELGELFNVRIEDPDTALDYAARLQDRGVKNVLVSMGGRGAVLAAENGGRYIVQAPSGTVKNTVGAGDSMVAGFLYGYRTDHCRESALRYGAAAGSATAFSDGLACRDDIEALLNNITVIRR